MGLKQGRISSAPAVLWTPQSMLLSWRALTKMHNMSEANPIEHVRSTLVQQLLALKGVCVVTFAAAGMGLNLCIA